eukprot:c26102_g1_i1 orf=166-1614(-)
MGSSISISASILAAHHGGAIPSALLNGLLGFSTANPCIPPERIRIHRRGGRTSDLIRSGSDVEIWVPVSWVRTEENWCACGSRLGAARRLKRAGAVRAVLRGEGTVPSPDDGRGENRACSSECLESGENGVLSLECSELSGCPSAELGVEGRPISYRDNRLVQMKDIAKGIKVASGVVKGLKGADEAVRKLRSPAEIWLMGIGGGNAVVVGLKVAKVLAKSIKVLKELVITLNGRGVSQKGIRNKVGTDKLRNLVKGLKASHGAAKIVDFAHDFGKNVDVNGEVELLDWKSVNKGYEFSKCSLSVLEAVIGLKGGVTSILGKSFVLIKGSVEGIGIMLKACFLSEELYKVVIKGFGISRGAIACYRAVTEEHGKIRLRGNSEQSFVEGKVVPETLQRNKGGSTPQKGCYSASFLHGQALKGLSSNGEIFYSGSTVLLHPTSSLLLLAKCLLADGSSQIIWTQINGSDSYSCTGLLSLAFPCP